MASTLPSPAPTSSPTVAAAAAAPEPDPKGVPDVAEAAEAPEAAEAAGATEEAEAAGATAEGPACPRAPEAMPPAATVLCTPPRRAVARSEARQRLEAYVQGVASVYLHAEGTWLHGAVGVAVSSDEVAARVRVAQARWWLGLG
jgi:hypothetical protein